MDMLKDKGFKKNRILLQKQKIALSTRFVNKHRKDDDILMMLLEVQILYYES